MHKITLIVGDWSGDGHEKTKDFTISSSLTAKELEKAYKAGLKKTGLEHDKMCSEYESTTIFKEEYKQFLALDPELANCDSSISDLNDDKNWWSVTPKEFAYMYMIIAKAGNSRLDWSLEETSESIAVGGYGLFDC